MDMANALQKLAKIFSKTLKISEATSARFYSSCGRCGSIPASKPADGLRPRRSLLYCPGNVIKKVNKAAGLPADVVVLDCEDGVAISKKEDARKNIQSMLPDLKFGKSESAVRINSADSEYAAEDLRSVVQSDTHPQAIMLPKIESADQLRWLKSDIEKHLLTTMRSDAKFSLIGQCETPLGMMNLRSIMEEGTRPHANISMEAMVFGSDDYLASIGATRTPEATELMFARQYFIMHVKGFGMQAIDLVDINFKLDDLPQLATQSEEGARMGFTGKQVIHPNQIEVVNRSFTPSPDKIEFALALVKAFDDHQLSGQGAFTFRGAMIDMPSVKQAQNILNLVTQIIC